MSTVANPKLIAEGISNAITDELRRQAEPLVAKALKEIEIELRSAVVKMLLSKASGQFSVQADANELTIKMSLHHE